MCDNVDCKTPDLDEHPIRLKEEFDYDYCLWCDECIKRDADMVLTRLSE